MKKENKYDHVGRPTNEEVKARKNKTLLKVGCGLALVLVAIFGIVFSINNSNFDLLKGSSTNSYIKKMETNSKIPMIFFRPDYINDSGTSYVSKRYDAYYSSLKSKSKNSNDPNMRTTNFSNYLFDASGFTISGVRKGWYSWDTIYVYSNGKLISSVKPNSNFAVSNKYLGKRLVLKVVANVGKKKDYRYLRLNVPSVLKKAPRCKVIPVSIVDNNNINKLSEKTKEIYLAEQQVVNFSIECDSYGVGFKNAPRIFTEGKYRFLVTSSKLKQLKMQEVVYNGKSKDGRYIYYSTSIINTVKSTEWNKGETDYFYVRFYNLKNKDGINAVESNRIKIIVPGSVG